MSLRTDIIAGNKKLNNEIFSLTPSTPITLFIIDCRDLAFDLGFISSTDRVVDPEAEGKVFRFHNNLKFVARDILFDTDKSGILDRYIAAPIIAEGFEYSGRGTLPTPRLSLTIQEDGLPILSALKQEIYNLKDLSAAKVTRIRTLAKYLHSSNFPDGLVPEGHDPDAYAEFDRDVFYIDRKFGENKSFIGFELASILDLQGIQLPGRPLLSTRCVHQYRGPGCMYEVEYRDYGEETIHGIKARNGNASEREADRNLNKNHLPVLAPPVATVNDEKIHEILGVNSPADFFNQGQYSSDKTYKKLDYVYLVKNQIKYYYVCKNDNPTTAPPNTTDWIADICSKCLRGCKFRHGPKGAISYGGPHSEATLFGYDKNYIPFGAFTAVNRQNG